jgi:hypothetical protein
MENEFETMGFVPIERELFHTPFWLLERVYSEFEALIDLKREARYSEKPKFHKVNGNFVEVKRGQIMASVRFLSSRWGWSNTKVTGFLSSLEKMGFATVDKRQGVTVITILSTASYETCIYKPTTGSDRQRLPSDTSRQGSDGQRQAATKQEERKEEGEEIKLEYGQERTPPTPSRGARGSSSKSTRRKKEQAKHPHLNEQMIRLGALFNRKETTKWNVAEFEAYADLDISEDDLELMERFYERRKFREANSPDLWKHDLKTLLNQWPAQMDRARGSVVADKSASAAAQVQRPTEPTGWRAIMAELYPRSSPDDFTWEQLWDKYPDVAKACLAKAKREPISKYENAI